MDKATIIRHLAHAAPEEQRYLEKALRCAILTGLQRQLRRSEDPDDTPTERQWFFVTGVDY